MSKSFFIPHPKLISALAGVLLLHLLFTYWSLSHVDGGDKVIHPAPVKISDNQSVVQIPSGNIFSLDRTLTVSSGNNGTEAKKPEPADDYQLGSIVREGKQLKAVFISQDKKMIIGVGENLSNLGMVTQISGNTVTTKNRDGDIRLWQLFPTFESKSDNQESKNK
ncbi:hypothetical protein [Vibrio aerogenes]|nr:hypothetical protein [Vibrio aerogenes]